MPTSVSFVYAAFWIALGVVLPLFFHLILLGPSFLPMHLSVFLAGFTLGDKMGLLVGFITPLLSFFITGMPPPPVLQIMIVELAVYGFASGFFYRRLKLNLWLSLILAMIVGRVVLAGWVILLSLLFFPTLLWSTYIVGAFIGGVPGMLLQLLVIPPTVKILKFQI